MSLSGAVVKELLAGTDKLGSTLGDAVFCFFVLFFFFFLVSFFKHYFSFWLFFSLFLLLSPLVMHLDQKGTLSTKNVECRGREPEMTVAHTPLVAMGYYTVTRKALRRRLRSG